MTHDPVVYWRPGCGFCRRLRKGLDRAGVQRTEHDIWDDEAARSFVRSVNGGNEIVPTVVIGDRLLVNPRVEEVLALVDLGV
ncbi:MAG: NrdH-redoxin [Actinobacteria bacterium]|nr:NrdH-redoxin [Actinomycetota bacterium]